MKKTIAVDFDGVIHGYSKGWQDGSIYDPPKDGAKESLFHLQNLGYEIVIYSTRNHDRVINGELQKGQPSEVAKYLTRYDIPFDRIHVEEGKPFCMMFIDDNAVRFDGSWVSTMNTVLEILANK